MGRIQIKLSDDVETAFRNSFDSRKKGDISKKIESLIRKDLGQEEKLTKKETKLLRDFSKEFSNFILKIYNSEEFSVLAANKVALEWDKLKQKYKIK